MRSHCAQLLGLVLDDDEAGALLAHLANQREDFRAALGIEIGGRLIEDDHARPQRQHRGDREALLLPARKRGGIAMLEIRAARPLRAPDRGARGSPRAASRRAPSRMRPHARRWSRTVAIRNPGTPCRFRRRDRTRAIRDRACPPSITTPRRSPPSSLGDDAVEDLCERRLARSRRAHDADHCAGALRQMHAHAALAGRATRR